MKKVFALILTLVLALGCAAVAQAGDEPFTIVFSVKTPSNDTFQSALATAIQNKAGELGMEMILMGAGSASNVSTQVQQLEDCVNGGYVDALIVNPLDSNAVIPALQKAKEAGIPVVIVDTPLPAGNEELYITYVGTDNYNAGYQAALAMGEKLGEGDVVLVRGANGNAAGDGRASGFKDGLGQTKLNLVNEQVGNWSNTEAMQVTENMLSANPDIKGLFSCSDVMVEGILQAYSDNGYASGSICTIAVDGAIYAVEWVQNGDIYATMAQFPSVMGETAVETLHKALSGEDLSGIEKYIDSGVLCVTADNAQQYLPSAF